MESWLILVEFWGKKKSCSKTKWPSSRNLHLEISEETERGSVPCLSLLNHYLHLARIHSIEVKAWYFQGLVNQFVHHRHIFSCLFLTPHVLFYSFYNIFLHFPVYYYSVRLLYKYPFINAVRTEGDFIYFLFTLK